MAQRSKGDTTYVPARFDFRGRKVVGPERPEPIVILLGTVFLVRERCLLVGSRGARCGGRKCLLLKMVPASRLVV